LEPQEIDMSASHNSAVLRKYIETVDAGGHVEQLEQYVQPDIILPADTTPNGRQGIEGLREHLEFLHRRVEYRSTVNDIVAEEMKIAARVTVKGKLLAEFMGIPPSEKEFCIDEFLFAEFRDGRISQIWRVVNLLDLVEQLRS
jgi:predicted ester cyclase